MDNWYAIPSIRNVSFKCRLNVPASEQSTFMKLFWNSSGKYIFNSILSHYSTIALLSSHLDDIFKTINQWIVITSILAFLNIDKFYKVCEISFSDPRLLVDVSGGPLPIPQGGDRSWTNRASGPDLLRPTS